MASNGTPQPGRDWNNGPFTPTPPRPPLHNTMPNYSRTVTPRHEPTAEELAMLLARQRMNRNQNMRLLGSNFRNGRWFDRFGRLQALSPNEDADVRFITPRFLHTSNGRAM